MKRLRILLAATLLTLPLAACGDDPVAPPTGQINGQVVIDGEGIDGISVTLSNGARTTTSGGGQFSFTGLERGRYTITLSLHLHVGDAIFDDITATVTIPRDGETVTRNFIGSWIRTASLAGTVTIDGQGLEGIAVALAGPDEPRTTTDENGRYEFNRLRAGDYTIEFSGFEDDVGIYSVISGPVSLKVGEAKVWNLEGSSAR
ncbi:MAG: carboxypeptidase-like regulatory domain-containing protein [Gemmatimonadota bacterium]|nr:carboxypeptidase-like regulatory domain-containing protein [Gemmatimonadota bacterium]